MIDSSATRTVPPRPAAFVGALAISFSAIFYRLSGVDPITGGFFRMVYALPALGLLAFLVRRSDNRSLRTRLFAGSAGVMLGIDVVAWQAAVDQIGAGLATLVANTQVVLVPLATWAIFGERPSNRALFAMPVVMTGLAAVTGLGSADAFGARPVLGVGLGVIAASFYTGFLMTYRRVTRADSPPAPPLFDATIGAAAVIGLVGSISGDLTIQPTWPGHGWLIALALGAQAAGWLAIGYALPRLPAAVTSFVIVLQPILTIVWGRIIFGEDASPIQLVGVAVVVTGILAVVTARNPNRETGSMKPEANPSVRQRGR